jgi:DnaJ-class molecular chaperone
MRLTTRRSFSFKSLKDYYQVMGVASSASHTDIRKRFILLTKTFHPDINPASGDRFREISEAYSVLSNESSKLAYDESVKTAKRTENKYTDSSRRTRGTSGSGSFYVW